MSLPRSSVIGEGCARLPGWGGRAFEAWAHSQEAASPAARPAWQWRMAGAGAEGPLGAGACGPLADEHGLGAGATLARSFHPLAVEAAPCSSSGRAQERAQQLAEQRAVRRREHRPPRAGRSA